MPFLGRRGTVAGDLEEGRTRPHWAAGLLEDLPRVRSLAGRTLVIKYGGAALAGGREGMDAVLGAIALLRVVGARPVLVHGGGPELSAMMKRLGKEAVFVDGQRVTDRETAEIAAMVLAGKVNKELVAALQRLGGRAVGISGVDGALFRARRRRHKSRTGGGVDLGFVGDVVAVETDVPAALLAAGFTPVIATVALGEEGDIYNVNADAAAGALAGALGADALMLLTDVPGVLLDPADPGSLCREMDAAQARRLMDTGVATGGMIPKLEACLAALEGGAGEALILDGREPAALLHTVFGGSKSGTRIVAGGGGGGGQSRRAVR